MKASTKRVLSIGLAGIFFLATLLVYGSLIRPELDRLGKERALNSSKDSLFNNQRNAVQEVQKLISQFQSIAKLQETVSLAMPVGENMIHALNQWQAIIKNTGVIIRSFSVKPLSLEPTKQPLVKRLGILDLKMTVDGPYDNLKTFLRAFETNVRVANVKEITFAPLTGSPLEELYTMSLGVEVYYQE